MSPRRNSVWSTVRRLLPLVGLALAAMSVPASAPVRADSVVILAAGLAGWLVFPNQG